MVPNPIAGRRELISRGLGLSAPATSFTPIPASPMMPPAAISPLAKREPGLTSLSAGTSPARRAADSTSQRTAPPAKMASVVPIEMYAPTAKASERIPSSSTTTTRNTPSITSPQGSLRVRMPLMTVDISCAWGAGARSLPMPWIHWTSICPDLGLYRYLPLAISGELMEFST